MNDKIKAIAAILELRRKDGDDAWERIPGEVAQ
jgi:hypothetical protein